MDTFLHFMPLIMFVSLLLLLFSGFPVAFVLGAIGISAAFVGIELGVIREGQLSLIVNRTYSGVVENLILVSIPMFIFMGTMLEVSGVARGLLHSVQSLLRNTPGGLALAVVLMGTVMAATTGIIGASVTMMTLIALPTMLEQNYDLGLSSGTIAASGTLGILIPPSIMLVTIGDMLTLPIGNLFLAALIPGVMLSGFYVLFVIVYAKLNPQKAPAKPKDDGDGLPVVEFLLNFLPAFSLIVLVLGSIFAGFATPTEASGVGALGATLLAFFRRKLSWTILKNVVQSTATTGAMLFMIFIGATAFSLIFRLYGGDELIVDFVQGFEFGNWGLLILLMAIIFALGFFFDWIEITLIVLPIFVPVLELLDFSNHLPQGHVVMWFAVLTAVNLQTSFLTPPFGFALFYMKGAASTPIPTATLYRGIIPFVIIQLIGLLLLLAFPTLVYWLPDYVFN